MLRGEERGVSCTKNASPSSLHPSGLSESPFGLYPSNAYIATDADWQETGKRKGETHAPYTRRSHRLTHTNAYGHATHRKQHTTTSFDPKGKRLQWTRRAQYRWPSEPTGRYWTDREILLLLVRLSSLYGLIWGFHSTRSQTELGLHRWSAA